MLNTYRTFISAKGFIRFLDLNHIIDLTGILPSVMNMKKYAILGNGKCPLLGVLISTFCWFCYLLNWRTHAWILLFYKFLLLTFNKFFMKNGFRLYIMEPLVYRFTVFLWKHNFVLTEHSPWSKAVGFHNQITCLCTIWRSAEWTLNNSCLQSVWSDGWY